MNAANWKKRQVWILVIVFERDSTGTTARHYLHIPISWCSPLTRRTCRSTCFYAQMTHQCDLDNIRDHSLDHSSSHCSLMSVSAQIAPLVSPINAI